MKKILENEIARGVMIALLGVDTFITLCLGSYLFTDYGIGHINVHPLEIFSFECNHTPNLYLLTTALVVQMSMDSLVYLLDLSAV